MSADSCAESDELSDTISSVSNDVAASASKGFDDDGIGMDPRGDEDEDIGDDEMVHRPPHLCRGTTTPNGETIVPPSRWKST